MVDIDREHIGWVSMAQPIIFPKDDIIDARIAAFKGENHKYDGCYIVRLKKATPTIDFVYDSLEEAERIRDFILSARKVVSLDRYRNKKND